MVRIAIRADGGMHIGMGHVMRCLSLATGLKGQGHVVYFISKYPLGIRLIEQAGFPVIIPPDAEITRGNVSDGPENHMWEVKSIIKAIKQYQIDILIIDSYNVSEQYFLSLKPHVRRVVYIDDENKLAIPADIVVNGNVTAEYLQYEKYHDDQVLLLGSRYNMLRAEFRDIPRRVVRENVEEIMITTGGTDPYNVTGKLLNIFLQADYFKDIKLNVLIGGGFANYQELIELHAVYKQIALYSTDIKAKAPLAYSTMPALMLKSDLAISAGGSTLYEFAACGTPVLAYIMAKNQEFLVNTLAHFGYVINLGWYDRIDESLVYNTKLLLEDYAKRVELAKKAQTLVDAVGIKRIVEKILM